jgi:putative membrane protein
VLIRFAIHVLALLFVFYFVWQVHTGRLLGAALIMALILGLLNAVVRPILLILTLPVTIITLGLFVIVLNILLFAASLWILGGLGYHFDLTFYQVLIGYVIYVVISTVLTHLFR